MGSAKAIRPEIQALRAVAVALVLIYHFWPHAIPGGFVGVDVFFVISGFLITTLLLREIDRTGTVSLAAFWARRARRLLPASLTVLVCVALATVVFVPVHHWAQYLGDLRASTAYVQNWHLAGTSVDYFAADQAPSPVEHFWSLSAEEQFYLAWPPLLLLSVALSRGRHARRRRRAVAAVIATTAVAALVYSIARTAANPAVAYFATPTRAWEFAAGGLLALLPEHAVLGPAVGSAVSWVGLAAILVAAFTFSDATPFPGVAAALPVAAACLVIRAGAPVRRWAPTRVMTLRPVQFAGDTSYSIYLWHWPLLVLTPFVLGHGVGSAGRVALVALTVAAAWVSRTVIEDPIRSGALTGRATPWTFASAAAGTAGVLAVLAVVSLSLDGEVGAAERASRAVVTQRPACFGAASRDPAHPCENARLALAVVPSPLAAKDRVRQHSCRPIGRIARKAICEFGVPSAQATDTVALLGDSHAGHWRPALEVMAGRRRWRGIAIGHQGCPFSAATKVLPEPERTRCLEWKAEVIRWFARHPEVHMVFVSEFAGGTGVVTRPGQRPFAVEVDGYARAWAALPPSVRRIVVIRDTPKARGNTDDCVQRALTEGSPAGIACAVPRRRALDPDPATVAAGSVQSGRVRVADLTRFFCDRVRCFPVVGGALVYKDTTHLTRTYAVTLAPYLAEEVERLTASSSAARRCFAAAARDPRRTCRTPKGERSVTPTPREARKPGPHTCRVIGHLVEKQLCEFGARAGRATRTVALVGDSHAGHWKPTMEVLARRRSWRGISLGHAGCPFSAATKLLPEPDRSHCVRWKRAVFAWFRRHPEVSIVVVSEFAGGTGVQRAAGQSAFAAEVAGYASAWKALPPSVEQVVVIRDTPKVRGNTDECVERAMARHQAAGQVCAVPRSSALEPDPAAVAARRARSGRIALADLTRYFCGARTCLPVVGGALVFKDTSHMTRVYARSLAPFLGRAIDSLVAPAPALPDPA
jgi:peptidoglycan/LPS O-acetylase OafA/YrhL